MSDSDLSVVTFRSQYEKLLDAEERAEDLLGAARAAAPLGHLLTSDQAVEWLERLGPALEKLAAAVRRSRGVQPPEVLAALRALGFELERTPAQLSLLERAKR
jgi:hypothetical protein